MNKPEIKVLQIKQKDFLFLGIENEIMGPIENADFESIWSNFFEVGGFDKIRPYQQKESLPMVIYHQNHSDDLIYFIGSIIEGVDEIPNGYTMYHFPECEFLVVTTEWLRTGEEALGEHGLGQCGEYEKVVEIPEGYIRYDNRDSKYILIERENFNTKKGSRYEFWVPIKKMNS
ncbi:GyrI-like domain-containing protein [Enterococcus sp. BWR-S5]|uniref:GyrI-like domain-containing protein n=1 Tax=Enterococcus sp. BWR-S5 TaxID=2787714 RepID=UPI001921221D|nr:GyrI-like domain-containing protein [Enterococcus sp. BWR-S5]MBL1226401.1 GyrI-like domain-containing protein [Enterococcus sp. BWR-S5]